jgi:hypothetical protein
MKLLKITYIHKDRKAINIHDFYYRDYESKLINPEGTGVRKLSQRMINEGKIITRTLILSDDGNKLECLTVFIDESALEEYLNHDFVKYSRELWIDRDWSKTTEIINLIDYNFLS